MHANIQANQGQPSVDCGHCSGCGEQACPEGVSDEQFERQRPIRGVRFVLCCMGLFLTPIALAVVGAALAGPGETGQALGGMAGFLGGMGGAVALTRLFRNNSAAMDEESS